MRILPEVWPDGEPRTGDQVKQSITVLPLTNEVAIIITGAKFKIDDGGIDILKETIGPCVLICKGQHLQQIVDDIREAAEYLGISIT
jgi:hypothetical protein